MAYTIGDPRNSLYFSSSLYSDEVITELLYKMLNGNYNRVMQTQAILDNVFSREFGFAYSGETKSGFKVRPDVNSKYKLTPGSYTAIIRQIPTSAIPTGAPYFNYYKPFLFDVSTKKAFLKKYGYGKVISFEQIVKDSKVFNRVPMLFIEEYFFGGLKVIQEYSGDLILIIDSNAATGITAATITSFLSSGARCTFMLERTHTLYYGSGQYSQLISTITLSSVPTKVIQMSKMTAWLNITTKITDKNTWDIYMPITNGNKTLYLSSSGRIVSTTVGSTVTYYMTADYPGFMDNLTTAITSGNIMLIHRPDRAKIDMGPPVFDEYNMATFAITDNATDPLSTSRNYGFYVRTPGMRSYARGRFITAYPEAAIAGMFAFAYPNKISLAPGFAGIPDMTKILYHETNLFIYPKVHSGTEYREHCPNIRRYKSHYPPTTLEGIYNDAVAHQTVVTSANFKYDFNDFLASEHYPDIRGYKLSKVRQLLADNPMWYSELQKILQKQTPAPFVYHDPDVNWSTIPVVNDTSLIALSPRDDIITFDRPQKCIKIHTDAVYPIVDLYVDHQFILPTYVQSYKGDVYIFFENKRGWLFTTGRISNCPITIDIYDKYSTNINSRELSTYTFSTIDGTDIAPLFPVLKRNKIAPIDIKFRNANTRAEIDPSKITLYTKVRVRHINANNNPLDIITNIREDSIITYLLTSDNDFFKTVNLEYFILGMDVEYIRNDDPNAAFSTKEFYADELYYTINDPLLIGVPIETYTVLPRTFKVKHDAANVSGTLLEDLSIELNDWVEDYDASKFSVYLVPPDGTPYAAGIHLPVQLEILYPGKIKLTPYTELCAQLNKIGLVNNLGLNNYDFIVRYNPYSWDAPLYNAGGGYDGNPMYAISNAYVNAAQESPDTYKHRILASAAFNYVYSSPERIAVNMVIPEVTNCIPQNSRYFIYGCRLIPTKSNLSTTTAFDFPYFNNIAIDASVDSTMNNVVYAPRIDYTHIDADDMIAPYKALIYGGNDTTIDHETYLRSIVPWEAMFYINDPANPLNFNNPSQYCLICPPWWAGGIEGT